MTRADAIKYLMAQATPIQSGQMNDVVQVAFDAAYNSVWGSYRWTVRHTQTSLTTTADGTTTDLPKDFERAIWMSFRASGDKYRIAIKPEEWFDLHHPYPDDDSHGKPSVCKIIYSPAASDKDWKVYWWRVPDAAYTIDLAYDRTANSGEFDKLPSHMQKPILTAALALVKSGPDRQSFDMLAERDLMSAKMADRTTSGVFPLFGPVPDFDSFEDGAVNVGDTNDPLDFYG